MFASIKTCSGFVPAVIFGQNGPLSGPEGSRGPEGVAQNRKGALGPLETVKTYVFSSLVSKNGRLPQL